MKKSGGGALGVTTGFALGVAVALGGVWAAGGGLQGRVRPSNDSISVEELKAKINEAEIACRRQFPDDQDGAAACFATLTERLQADFERGVSTRNAGGTARAAHEAGIR